MKRQLKWFSIGFLLCLMVTSVYLWFDRALVENRILDAFIKKIGPNLPFKIESYHLGRNLEFFEVHLVWNELKISLVGPLGVKWIKKEGLAIEYHPVLQLGDASPLTLDLASEISTRFEVVDGVRLKINPQPFRWKSYGIDFKDLSASLDLDHSVATLELSAKSLAWTDSHHSDHAVNADTLRLSLKIPNVHEPLLGDLLFSVKSSEVLWEKFYADLALETLPLHLVATTKAVTEIDLGKRDELKVKVTTEWTGNKVERAKVKWETSALDLPLLAPWVLKNLPSTLPSLRNYADLEVKSGRMRASGEIDYSATASKTRLQSLKIRAEHVNARSVSHSFSFKDLNLYLPYRAHDVLHSALLEVPVFYYKHFEGRLEKTEVKWSDQAILIPTALAIKLKDIPLKIGPVSGKRIPELELKSSLQLEKTELSVLLAGFCIPGKKIPPAQLEGNFTSLEYSPGVIDPTGKLILNLFKGRLELNDIGFFDLDTEVPEINFDANWSGIDMQSMGEWSKFGEIKGTLEGYAHEVIFQSFLPTRYHFLLQVKPLNLDSRNPRVEFSPEAMKNVVKVFTGASLDEQIPGIAGWLMFGWPSRVLGGYDVNYAGIKLTSEEGRIIVETLDTPAIFAKERKHFVLYGPRFKMPLRNPNYPLLIDATSMSNFVHQLMVQLGSIKKKKEGSLEDEDAPIQCDPPEL
ncbi:MAG: hypothetical protein H7333_05970 [Bdellovibrionales bacterium]|nr:hypothetical protein [Oligoflexia bacterium]